jgi:hypothetical protein
MTCGNRCSGQTVFEFTAILQVRGMSKAALGWFTAEMAANHHLREPGKLLLSH